MPIVLVAIDVLVSDVWTYQIRQISTPGLLLFLTRELRLQGSHQEPILVRCVNVL
jgi:hypothetical protein